MKKKTLATEVIEHGNTYEEYVEPVYCPECISCNTELVDLIKLERTLISTYRCKECTCLFKITTIEKRKVSAKIILILLMVVAIVSLGIGVAIESGILVTISSLVILAIACMD